MAKKQWGKSGWIALVVLESAMWGVGNPVMKIALWAFTPLWCLALRFVLAFMLFAVCFGRRTLRRLNRQNLPGLMVSALFNTATYLFTVFALRYSKVTVAGFLMSLAVVFTPFLSFFFIKRRFNWRMGLIVALVVAGIYLLCTDGASFTFGTGELLAVMCSLCFAAGLVATAKLVHNVEAAAVSTVQVGVTAAVSLGLALALEDGAAVLAAPAGSWLAVIYMAVGCTFAAYLIQNFALKHISPVAVSLAFSSEPAFTAAACAVMLGERLAPLGYTGAALVIAGIVMSGLVQERK